MDLNNNVNVNESNNYLIDNSSNLFNTNPHLLTSLHNLNQPNYSQLITSIDDHVILGNKITFNVVNFNNLFVDKNITPWQPDTDKRYLLDYSHLLPSTTSSKEIDFHRLTGNSEIPLLYPVPLLNKNEASLLESSATINVGLNSNCIAGILQQDIYPTLQQFVKLPNFQELMHSIFGDNLDAGKLTQITSQWLIGNFSLLPQIKVEEESVFSASTLGAFAGTTEKIYLSEKLFNSGNTDKIGDIILEEVGHWLDKQLNQQDTPGDEGQLFADVVRSKYLNAQEIAEIRAEDDSTRIFIDSQYLTVEQASLPTITIAVSDATAAETISGQTANPGKFTIKRTGDLSSTLAVNYIVGGTATNGTDYNQLTGVATFSAGLSTTTIDLTVINDAILETQETVVVTLSSNSNYILGTATTASVNIVDNDKPTITIKASDASAGETVTGITANPGRFTLTRTGDLSSSPTINYTVTGTAVNGTDYQTLTKTVAFAAGSATAIINVTPIDDAVYEGNETVIVNLASSVNYILGTAKTATINLVDNDKPTITIAATDSSAGETLTGQTANPGKLTLTRTGNKTASLTVNYTVAGTAINGTDYQTLTKTVTFAAGSATAIIDVTPIDDAIYEGNETAIVTLASGTNYVLGTAKTATVNLADNDSATTVKPTITISPSDATAGETVAGTTVNRGQFKLTRTGDLSASLTVSYSVAGTATNGIDYNNLSGTATFSAGVSTALINVNSIDDAIYEGGETLIVTLSSNTNYNLGTAKTATVNIADNDPVPYITVGSPNGGDSLLIDGNSNITWNDNISENVKIDLYENGIFHSNIFRSTPSDGSETWNVSGTLFSDSNYQIKISSVNNPNLFDFSDSNFTIRRNWVQRVGSEQDDSLIAIDTDSNNNIYITGTSNSFSAGLLIKQDSVMNTTWFQTGLPRYSTGLAVDNNSNVYVSRPNNFLGGNVLIDKYDTVASLVWNRQLDSGYRDIESSIATDINNNIYISGSTNGSLDGTNAGDYDAFIAKYNSIGTLLWTKQLGTSSYDAAKKVAIDINGNAYIYGTTTGNLVGNNLGGNDFFLAKYSSSGNLLWTRQLGTTFDDEANSLATDSNGNIYIYGNVGTNIGGQISTDVFLAKYSSSGNSLWTKKVGTTFSDEAGGIRTDNNGNVYIAGSTSGNIAGDNQGAKDVFVIKYDPSGNLLWSEQFGSSGDDISRDIAVDNNQRIYVVGDTTGSLSSTLTNEGGTDGFIRKLSPISQGLIPITVTSPNGGNTFQMGSSYNITWNDSISENVKIDLYKGDVFNRTLFTSTASDGNESWTLPSNLVAGSDYQIKISSVNNTSLFDFGNANFSVIPAPFINVASPNGGETLQVGNTYNITWTDNISENVKIDLFKGGIFNSTIFSSTVSDGSESWTLPSNFVAGADYQIKISSVNNSNLYDWSNSNFTLSQSDLVITSQSVSSSVTTNSTVSISSYTYNQGAATAGSNYVRYWLSDDATLNTSTDRFLGYNSVGSLSSGTSEYDSFSFTYDASWGTGTKYIFFEADGYGYVAESNESNNLAYQAITINGSVMQYGFTYYYNVSANNVVGSGDYYEGYFYAPVGNYALGNYYDVNSNNNESGFNGKYYINSSTVQGTSSDLGKIYVTRYYDRTGSNYTSYTPYYNSLGQVSGTNYLGSEYDFIGSNDSIHKDFGQDAFEYNAPSSDIDIRLDFTYSGFNQTQINILEQAAQNWERIITRDMVPGGVIDVVVTQGSTTQYGTAWNGMWATTDFPYAIGTIATPNIRYNLSNSYDNQRGIDYHTRMHFNSSTLPTLSSNLLVRLVMHELGHALYLDEAQYDSLLGLDGVMDLNGLDARITEGVYQRLEYLGYGVDRNAIVYWS